MMDYVACGITSQLVKSVPVKQVKLADKDEPKDVRPLHKPPVSENNNSKKKPGLRSGFMG